MWSACHKKSYLLFVELTNFGIFTKPFPIFFSKQAKLRQPNRPETADFRLLTSSKGTYLCKKTPKLVDESQNFNVHIDISFEYVYLMCKIHLILYPFNSLSLSNISQLDVPFFYLQLLGHCHQILLAKLPSLEV